MGPEWIRPEWPAPRNIRALSTTRKGGVSMGPYASLNLGEHVGDDPKAVSSNRARVQTQLGHATPRWLNQVHGVHVVTDDGSMPGPADAAVSLRHDTACVIMTAHTSVETVTKSLGSGAIEYLGKPLLIDDLLALVRRVQ
ncbi:MAG: laccase domain-containing protein, partial [Gammaproteobacteria bacterium]